ncbi:MAG: hypothetical protein IKX60_09005 [Bacteroidales bacterium]|nr:hypothetical protein [Bacteroidales bacterium]
MTDTRTTLQAVIDQTVSADLNPLRNFLFSNPSEPLIATGSGGAETSGEFAALLYGACGGVATSVTPYTFNSYSDEALKTAKILLVSKGGHNNDIVFATKRALAVNPGRTAAVNFSDSDRNEARKVFQKAGSDKCFVIPMKDVHDGFVSTGTSLSYFAIFTKIFQPDVDLEKYRTIPENPFTLCRNDGTPLTAADFSPVRSYIILQGSWGRPVANNLEGKLVECGLASAGVYDYRNYCHGRFIFTSNHLEDSVVILLVSPRERDIVKRTRDFLPMATRLVIIETEHDAPEASLDLLIRSTEFYHEICSACGVDPESPKNPGRIDKRKPIWVPFMAELKKQGPLTLADIMKSPVIEGTDECPWCRAIMRDAAELLPDDVLDGMGAKLYVADWDLDRISLTKEPTVDDDDCFDNYSIRTWNISRKGVIDWTLFKTVTNPDGSAHGEELCSGSTDCTK